MNYFRIAIESSGDGDDDDDDDDDVDDSMSKSFDSRFIVVAITAVSRVMTTESLSSTDETIESVSSALDASFRSRSTQRQTNGIKLIIIPNI
jgi:K+/H+ antiporter YhaU regulatory subunit KhtT